MRSWRNAQNPNIIFGRFELAVFINLKMDPAYNERSPLKYSTFADGGYLQEYSKADYLPNQKQAQQLPRPRFIISGLTARPG